MAPFTTTHRRSVIASLALLACLVLPGAASADRRTENLLESWRERLDRIDENLVEGRWKRSHRDADALIGDMLRRLSGGEGTAVWLSRAVMRRAVAEVGLGNREDALWDHRIASRLAPAVIGEMDLGRFGAVVGSLFTPRVVAAPAAAQTTTVTLQENPEIVPPTAIKNPVPSYPIGHALACNEGLVIVQTKIGVDGLVREPRILEGEHPMLAFAALDSLRHWRFDPARRDGDPVEVYYNLTINFRPSWCDGEDGRESPAGSASR